MIKINNGAYKVRCLTCKWWELSPGSPDYSEYTPGESAHFECKKGMFEFYGFDMPDIPEFLREERYCDGYKHFAE